MLSIHRMAAEIKICIFRLNEKDSMLNYLYLIYSWENSVKKQWNLFQLDKIRFLPVIKCIGKQGSHAIEVWILRLEDIPRCLTLYCLI